LENEVFLEMPAVEDVGKFLVGEKTAVGNDVVKGVDRSLFDLNDLVPVGVP
jgi:hypothetical protein